MFEPQGGGGIAHYTYQLANHLVGEGADIVLYTTDNYELSSFNKKFKVKTYLGKSVLKERLFNIFKKNNEISYKKYNKLKYKKQGEIVRFKKTNLYSHFRQICLEWELLFHFLKENSKIVHFQWVWPNESSLRFLKFLKYLGFKIVYTAHNILPHENKTLETIKNYEKWYKTVDKIIVHSQNNKKEIISIFNLDENKIAVIPHGNYDFFLQKKISKNKARKRLNIPFNKKVILFFGAIRKYKGLEYLIKAFKKMANLRNDVILIIAGRFGYEDKDTNFFKKLFYELNIQKKVIFRPQYISFEEVNDYFITADIIVLPYIKTYQSGIVQLAYAFGKPVIVTKTGGLPEVVEDGKSGYIVPPKDEDAPAEAIIKILKDEEKLLQMGKYAQFLSQTKFSWNTIAKKTISLYKNVLTC